MKKRYIEDGVAELCFGQGKMTLVSGPRQCGKTTMAKHLLKERGAGAYYNWDDPAFRRTWIKSPGDLAPRTAAPHVPLLVLDEIHKDRRWKRTLKGIYDTIARPCDILVTGSARLNVYKKGSDSLVGRYFSFRLHPFSVRELHGQSPPEPDRFMESFWAGDQTPSSGLDADLEALLQFGPFPEPLFRQHVRAARLWLKTRREQVLREDLRDLSRIPDLARIELMVALLPERVGSLFSINSLREDLEVSHDSVSRWISYLKELYYLYELKPYARHIPRALKKEGKIYFWDFSEVSNPGARLENLVANHLLKACHFWTDMGHGQFDLHYLRNKEKQEIDFLVTRNGAPWLPIEVKTADINPSPHWRKFLPVLPCKRGVQLVRHAQRREHRIADGRVMVADVAEFLFGLA